jgi:MFS transporter, PAT family, beta-lactamase induction signal transducer AmpG
MGLDPVSQSTRRGLPVWLLGLANLPLGFTFGFGLMVAPEVLAARHVPETTIADITTLGLVGNLAFFLVAPVLDVNFSRRTYAIVMSSAVAILTLVMVLNLAEIRLLGLCLLLAMLAANLNTAALGGWFGSALPKEKDAQLGAWFAVASFGGFGLASMLGIELIHHDPLWLAATILAAMNLPPLAIILAAHCPEDKRSRLSETFGRFGRELAMLASRRDVRRLFLLLVLPCTSFALTNTLGGLGGDYGASERLVATIGGVGVTAAGIVGSLTVPVVSRRAGLIAIYLGIGIVGALSTLSLIVLPNTPAVYTIGLIAQNIWQSSGLAAGTALILTSIGKDNPLASTQFAILNAALATPLIYMQWIDGHAYGAHGLTGLYLMDGGLDLASSVLMIGLFLVWSKSSRGGLARSDPLRKFAL